MSSDTASKSVFACDKCDFSANSARQLSRHSAHTHTQNPLLRCVLCPFLTTYKTNLLRHRREVHGIVGSRGNKSCKFCGFKAEDSDAVILHQQQAHQDILRLTRERFTREKKGARGNDETYLANGFTRENQFNMVNKEALNDNLENPSPGDGGEDDDRDFWKESFLDDPPNLMFFSSGNMNAYQSAFSLDDLYNVNGQTLDTPFSCTNYDQPNQNGQSRLSSDKTNDKANATSSDKLPVKTKKRRSRKSHLFTAETNGDSKLALPKIRRHYMCTECDFKTFNPREFLYHRKDLHNEKVKIVECPYCMYACQYFQKLQRHILLVHKITTTTTPPPSLASSNKSSENGSEHRPSTTIKSTASTDTTNLDVVINEVATNFSKAFLAEHSDNLSHEEDASKQTSENGLKVEKGVKKKKKKKTTDSTTSQATISSTLENGLDDSKFSLPGKKASFKCTSCPYITHVYYLYKKHLKLHNSVKVKCASCDFESPYFESNKNHPANGTYRCIKCSLSLDKSTANHKNGLIRCHSEFSQHQDDGEYDTSRDCHENGIGSEKRALVSDRSTNGTRSNFTPKYGDDDRTVYPADCEKSIEFSKGLQDRYNEEEDELDEELDIRFSDSNSLFNEEDLDEELNARGSIDGEIDDDNASVRSVRARVYQCNYCEFRCPTPSRFHVHILQHINTKPFMCSECGHRSNWEWDVTKHIKMKLLRDPKHSEAKPVIVHDSGKRDYTKYDRYLKWVEDASDGVKSSVAHSHLKALKKAKISEEDGRFDDESDYCYPSSYHGQDDMFAPENIVITPDLPFPVPLSHLPASYNSKDDYSSVYNTYRGLSNCMANSILQPNIRYISPPYPQPFKATRELKCAYCKFTHQSIPRIVNHLSVHAGKKPYKCKYCSFSSNWKEVVVHHLSSRHDKTAKDVVQLLRYRVSNSICRIVNDDDDDVQLSSTESQEIDSAKNMENICGERSSSDKSCN